MGEKVRRVASFLGPPWVSESERVFPDEPVLAEFTGFWARVYVTEHWLIIRTSTKDVALKHAEIADVRAGFDPSPHDDGGPFRGIWLTMTYGKEHGVGLFRAEAAGHLIRSLSTAAGSKGRGDAQARRGRRK